MPEELEVPEDKKKFFILTPGRCGSSLLSSILDDAGATFPAASKTSWSSLAGAYEDDRLDRTAFLLAQAHAIQQKYEYFPFYKLYDKKFVTFKRFFAKREIHKIFATSSFFKETGNMHHVARFAAHLGYWPVIILNWRSYEHWMGSMYPGQRNFDVEDLSARYVAILRNSLALLSLFGGCVVNYTELTDLEATDWADNLGRITGLDPKALLEARQNRYRAPGPETALAVSDPAAERIQSMIRDFEGRITMPAPAAVKRWLRTGRA